MSSIGRPSQVIDLNTKTISYIDSLTTRVEINEEDISALKVRATSLEDNVGIPSNEEQSATGLNLKVCLKKFRPKKESNTN